MHRIILFVGVALIAAGCGADLYESPDFAAIDAGPDVVLWRLVEGPAGLVGIGGPIQAEDLEEGAPPLTLRSYRSSDGRTWESGDVVGSIATPLLGLTARDNGYAASGVWDGVPAVLLSHDGLSWRRIELTADAADVDIESAGIAGWGDTVIATGFSATDSPIIWIIEEGSPTVLADTSAFPASTRLTQVVAGPARLVAASGETTSTAAAPPIWVSLDGRSWDAVLARFEGDTYVTGLIGSADGYVAVVAETGSDEQFTLWTTTDGIDWTRRADQDSVFGHLTGKGGDLLADLMSAPSDAPQPRPIAFSFNGRWLEITEAIAGDRFLAVAVVGTDTVRVVSGFSGSGEPIPLVLVAGG